MRVNQFFKLTKDATTTKVIQVVSFDEESVTYRDAPNAKVAVMSRNEATMQPIRRPAKWDVMSTTAPKKVKPTSTSVVNPKATKREPALATKPVAIPVKVEARVQAIEAAVPADTAITKKDQARAMYRTMLANGKSPSRKEVVAEFKSKLGLTSNGASTYATIVRNENPA